MEKPAPIRLPEDIEKEELAAKEREIQDRLAQQRADNTLLVNLIKFLKEFEEKIIAFNIYILAYLPYPSISKTVKDIVRNKLRKINEFYHSFSGSNPHSIICELEEKNTTDSNELRTLHMRLSNVLGQLNDNVACISNKHVIMYHVNTSYKEFEWA